MMKKPFSLPNSAGELKIAPLMGYPGIKPAGVSLYDSLHESGAQYAAVETLYEKFHPDFVFPFMDLTVECEAVGASLRYPPGEPPLVEKKLVSTYQDLENLRVPEIGENNRLHVYVETLELLVKNLPSATLKCGYIMGPLSLAGQLMGTGELALNSVLKPQMVHDLLQFCTELLQKYLAALLAVKPNAIMILEPTASLFSPRQVEEFSHRYIQHLTGLAGETAYLLHNCGRIDHLVEAFASLKIEGVSIGSCAEAAKIYSRLPEDFLLFGNLDPTRVFLRGKQAEVLTETKKLLNSMKGKKNFILSTACDLPPAVPLSQIKTFIETARNFPWNQKPIKDY